MTGLEMLLTTLLLVVVAWLVAGVLLAFVLGAVVRIRDHRAAAQIRSGRR